MSIDKIIKVSNYRFYQELITNDQLGNSNLFLFVKIETEHIPFL